MKQVIFTNIQESPLKIVAGGGWRPDADLRRHRKSAAWMVFTVVWVSIVFLIYSFTQTSAQSSGFLHLPMLVWLLLLPAIISLACVFYSWRKEKHVLRESKSKLIPPRRLRNLY